MDSLKDHSTNASAKDDNDPGSQPCKGRLRREFWGFPSQDPRISYGKASLSWPSWSQGIGIQRAKARRHMNACRPKHTRTNTTHVHTNHIRANTRDPPISLNHILPAFHEPTSYGASPCWPRGMKPPPSGLTRPWGRQEACRDGHCRGCPLF